MTARRLLRLGHAWIGAVAALFLLLVALSGAGLAFMSEMFVGQYGDMLLSESPAAPPADVDRLYAAARAAHPEIAPIGMLMPHSRVPGAETAMIFGMPPGSGAGDAPLMMSVDPATAVFKGAFALDDAFAHQLIDFHNALLFGPIGAIFVAFLGLLLAAFALSGLWLWWPRDGRVWAKARAPALAGGPRRAWFAVHGWVGIWLALLIVGFGVTGTATSQPGWFGALLASEDDHPPQGAAFARRCAGVVTPGDAARLAASRYPDRRLSILYGGPGATPWQLMLKAPGDLNTMEGDVVFWVHRSCAGVGEGFDLGRGSLADRAGAMMFSLHGGYSFGPVIGKLLVIVGGLGLALLCGSGLYVFATRTLKLAPRRAVTPQAAE